MNIKTFEIDFDSVDDCSKLRNQMKSRLGELKLSENGHVSRNQMVKNKFDACMSIYKEDISDLYINSELDEAKKYYVYVHCYPDRKIALKRDGVSTFGATLGMTHLPFYIGMGSGDRAYKLDRNETHRKVRQKIKLFNDDIKVTIIKEYLSEKEALILESKLIDIFGLISIGGKLVNLDEGVKPKERKQRYLQQLKVLSLFYKGVAYS